MSVKYFKHVQWNQIIKNEYFKIYTFDDDTYTPTYMGIQQRNKR